MHYFSIFLVKILKRFLFLRTSCEMKHYFVFLTAIAPNGLNSCFVQPLSLATISPSLYSSGKLTLLIWCVLLTITIILSFSLYRSNANCSWSIFNILCSAVFKNWFSLRIFPSPLKDYNRSLSLCPHGYGALLARFPTPLTPTSSPEKIEKIPCKNVNAKQYDLSTFLPQWYS